MTGIKTKYKIAKEFVARINGKDPVAWEELYDRYYKALCAYSASLSGDAAAAEDLVQELLLKIWQSEITFSVLPELVAYLYRAVHRNSLAYRRDRNNRISLLKTLHEEHSRQETKNYGLNISDEEAERTAEIVGEEVIRHLYNGIQSLTPEQRRIILLSIAGVKGEEIARRLGISINTVKTQKYRGYRTLRNRLGKLLGLGGWIIYVLWKDLV